MAKNKRTETMSIEELTSIGQKIFLCLLFVVLLIGAFTIPMMGPFNHIKEWNGLYMDLEDFTLEEPVIYNLKYVSSDGRTKIEVGKITHDCYVYYDNALVLTPRNDFMSKKVAKRLMKATPKEKIETGEVKAKKEFRERYVKNRR